MKKLVSIILSLSISIVLFMACSNDSAPPVVPIIPPVETSPVKQAQLILIFQMRKLWLTWEM